MIVMEKNRDIGVLRAVGFSRRKISQLFLLEGGLVGLIGVGLGICLALAVGFLQIRYGFFQIPAEIYFMSQLAVEFHPQQFHNCWSLRIPSRFSSDGLSCLEGLWSSAGGSSEVRMKNLTLGLGRRFLVSRKRVGFVSWSAVMAMLGVAVGCFAVLAAIAVLNGFTNELEERVSGFESDLRIANISLDENLQAKIKSAAVSIPEVEDASFYLERKGIIIRDDNRQLVTLKAVESDKLGSVYRPFMESELDRPMEKSGIVMGTELAARLQVRPGDRLRLVSPTSGQLALGFPTWGDVEVQGVFRTGIPIFDDRVCFIPMEMGKTAVPSGYVRRWR